MQQESHILARLISPTGIEVSEAVEIPISLNYRNLNLLLNQFLENPENEQYSFYIQNYEIKNSLLETIKSINDTNIFSEKILNITYRPQASFHVRPITRCTSTIEGHSEAVISAQFSANGRYLCSGSGDTTVRFWDIYTELPQFTCKGHKNWVLCISWSPDGNMLSSACKNGQIFVWDPSTGNKIVGPINAHSKWINSIAWKPLNIDGESKLFVSGSKDKLVKIWNAQSGKLHISLSGHTMSVTCVKWSTHNLIYSCSQDRTIKVWRPDGVLCRTCDLHAHWVNFISLNTDYAIRTGAFDPATCATINEPIKLDPSRLKIMATDRLTKLIKNQPELVVSCSDDYTLYLWKPQESKQSICRMTGHQAAINDVRFSPNGFLIASASFDKSVKLWSGTDGKYITSFRGHVQRVYQISWSADSRLLCSASADSTLKVWNISKRGLLNDLPGHADEIYTLDWSPDSQRVVSGGKDKHLKIWRS